MEMFGKQSCDKCVVMYMGDNIYMSSDVLFGIWRLLELPVEGICSVYRERVDVYSGVLVQSKKQFVGLWAVFVDFSWIWYVFNTNKAIQVNTSIVQYFSAQLISQHNQIILSSRLILQTIILHHQIVHWDIEGNFVEVVKLALHTAMMMSIPEAKQRDSNSCC